jgi:sec-independent protein translocase protein TatA
MGDAFAPWHIIILAVVFIVLFGARKLPDSARSLGQAMRIFKAETKGLHTDEDGSEALPARSSGTAFPAAAQQATAQQATAQPDATQQQIQDLQRQLQELQKQPAGDGTTVNGMPLSEAQPGHQPF